MFSRYKGGRKVGAMALLLALFVTACGEPVVEETATAPADAAEAVEATTSEDVAGGPGLPALSAATVTGGQIDTNDLEGQDVIVWFWAPW